MFSLNLPDEQNHVVAPGFTAEEISSLLEKLRELKITSHVLIASSGTTGGNWKGYLISQKALFTNARAVNARLGLTAHDRWGASLPYYHIGGLSIYYRAHLLGHEPISLRPWSPATLVDTITNSQVTVISLVPTQVFDLVELKIAAPRCLKTVLVGGDFLSVELARRFMLLGWPLTRTYGMTEVSSQLCSGTNEQGDYRPLAIHQLKTDEHHSLLVRSESIFSYVVTKNKDWVFKPIAELLDQDGFLKLSDKAQIQDGHLRFLGRGDGQIKSSGHLVNLTDLKERLELFLLERHSWGKMEIQSKMAAREGAILILHYLDCLPSQFVEEFLLMIQPIKIDQIKKHVLFNRTKLGKFIAP